MIPATEHDGPHERCPLCRYEHCEVRWFHRFPAADEDHAPYRGVVRALRRPWAPDRPEPVALGGVRL